MFAKRHYEAIATVMQNAHPGAGLPEDNRARIQWEMTCLELANTFRQDNPNFDMTRFIRACKPGANVRARNANRTKHDRQMSNAVALGKL